MYDIKSLNIWKASSRKDILKGFIEDFYNLSKMHYHLYKLDKEVTYNGIGFAGLLTIVFIVLKLCGVINWSWVWVLSPLWISFGLGIIFITILLIILVFVSR